MDNHDAWEWLGDAYGMYVVGLIFFGIFFLMFMTFKFIIELLYRILRWMFLKIRDWWISNRAAAQE